MIVSLIQGRLDSEGIATVLKNDMSSGGAGELAPTDLWPEIWLVDDTKEAKAQTIIANIQDASLEQSWQCQQCGETNEATFEVCWHCQSLRPQDVNATWL